MKKYVLSCSSTVDLSREHLAKRDINWVSFHYSMDDEEYVDDLGKTMDFEAFYDLMEKGVKTKTSQVNVDEFIEYFTPFLKKGNDILHLTISSGLSGEHNSALIAKESLKETFPNQEIIIIDSLAASSGYGLLMDKLADLKEEGYDLHNLANYAEKNKLRVQHWFYTSELKYFVRGGRLSKTAGFVGSLLNLCPVMYVDEEGKLIPKFKIVGRKRAKQKLLTVVEELIENGLDYNEKIYISHANVRFEAESIKTALDSHFLKSKEDVLINWIGTTVGSHTGPGTIAVFFFGKRRDE